MTLEEHVATAERFLASSRLLQDAGDDMGSAELVWGAAMQAVHALHHRDRDRHPHNIRALESIVTVQFPASIATRLAGGLDATVRLHNYFYTGRLSSRTPQNLIAQSLAVRMAQGGYFVSEVLQLAQALP